MKPLRVLQIVSKMDMGGLETLIMNIYRNIDKTKIQFDFLVHHEEEGVFEKEIKKLGGKIYRVPFVTKVGHFKYIKALDNFFYNNNYEIIHSHFNTISGLILRSAKRNGISVRISHSHIANPNYKNLEKIYKNYSKFFINRVTTDRFSCGLDAGKWLYGENKKFKIINNGIVLESFQFSKERRKKKRAELGLKNNELIIGHVGRFNKQKNHLFLLKVFKEIYKQNNNAKLILIGDGLLRDEVEEFIIKNKIKNVELLGIRNDVKDLLNVFDMFVLPSLYEGLPVTLIENQGNGLKSFVSNEVAKEADMGCDLIEYISLEESPQSWAKAILKDMSSRSDIDNEKIKLAMRKRGYDIKKTSEWLENFYFEKAKK